MERKSPRQRKPGPPKGEAGPRLLVVEDDPGVRRALERGLRARGVRAVFASTLSEGLAKLDGCDVALVDFNLPDGLGTDLVRAVRLESRPVRVAIYSGSVDAEAAIAASGERPDAIFSKPMDLNKLLAWIGGASSKKTGK